MTNRMDHTECSHDATPAGRKACRAGNARMVTVRQNDMVQVEGRGWVVVREIWSVSGFPTTFQGMTGEWFGAWTVTGHEARPVV